MRIRWAVFVILGLIALLVRLPQLDRRPMHTDEAVNGYITGQLLEGGSYEYDPEDRHGPALYLAALPFAKAANADKLADLSEPMLRRVPAFFSLVLVLLLGMAAARVGFIASVVAALLFIVAPLPVYYGRYFIHELLFLCGTLAMILAGLRWLESRDSGAAMATGAAAAFMLACKETAVLHYTAAALPIGWWLWNSRSAERKSKALQSALKTIGVAAVTFMAVTVAFYTWGGRNWQGPWDLLLSFPRFAARAGGEGHEKPWFYYATLLGGNGFGWTVIILAVVSGLATVPVLLRNQARPSALAMMALYAAAICAIYSVIPYKNPWLGLNLWLPLAVLAGGAFETLWNKWPRLFVRIALMTGLILLLGGFTAETYKWSFAKPADEKNPYAYAHTVQDLLGLPERISELKLSQDARISVVAADPWPLPWYLRGFQQVGYYQPDQDPGRAELYITSLEAAERVGPYVSGWYPDFFGVRPEVLLLLWAPPPSP